MLPDVEGRRSLRLQLVQSWLGVVIYPLFLNFNLLLFFFCHSHAGKEKRLSWQIWRTIIMLRPLLLLPPYSRSPRASTAFFRRLQDFHTYRCPSPLGLSLGMTTSGQLSSLPVQKNLCRPAPASFPLSGGRRAFSMPPGGGSSWVSPDAVPKGENLKKYSRNLTKEAMDGRLDPVSRAVGLAVPKASWSCRSLDQRLCPVS